METSLALMRPPHCGHPLKLDDTGSRLSPIPQLTKLRLRDGTAEVTKHGVWWRWEPQPFGCLYAHPLPQHPCKLPQGLAFPIL